LLTLHTTSAPPRYHYTLAHSGSVFCTSGTAGRAGGNERAARTTDPRPACGARRGACVCRRHRRSPPLPGTVSSRSGSCLLREQAAAARPFAHPTHSMAFCAYIPRGWRYTYCLRTATWDHLPDGRGVTLVGTARHCYATFPRLCSYFSTYPRHTKALRFKLGCPELVKASVTHHSNARCSLRLCMTTAHFPLPYHTGWAAAAPPPTRHYCLCFQPLTHIYLLPLKHGFCLPRHSLPRSTVQFARNCAKTSWRHTFHKARTPTPTRSLQSSLDSRMASWLGLRHLHSACFCHSPSCPYSVGRQAEKAGMPSSAKQATSAAATYSLRGLTLDAETVCTPTSFWGLYGRLLEAATQATYTALTSTSPPAYTTGFLSAAWSLPSSFLATARALHERARTRTATPFHTLTVLPATPPTLPHRTAAGLCAYASVGGQH